MKKFYSNKIVRISLILSICFFLIEILFRLVIGFTLLDVSMIRILLADIIFSLFLSIFLSFLKTKYANIIITILLILYASVSIFQGGMYNYLGTFMSFNTASQAGAVGDYIGDFIRSINPWFYSLLLIPIFFIIYTIFLEKKIFIDVKKKYNVARFIASLLIILNCGLFYGSLVIPSLQNSTQIISNKELFANPSIPNITVNQFGILGYEFIDVKAIIIPEEVGAISFSKPIDSTDLTEEEVNYARVIDDTAWESANEEEDNKTYKTLNSYFLSKEITSKNEYTGMFKGKNLVIIMIESGSNILKDYPEYFPNFSKLYNEGWSWDNAFSPRNSCSTGNNEMTGILSLYPINNTCTVNTYKNNTYFESIFNLFNNAGYTTSSYHDYTDHFYARTVYHPNMGSGTYYSAAKLGINIPSNQYQPWPSDEEFIEKALPTFVNEEHYMTWFTTVTSHMRYNISSMQGDLYLDLFEDEDWSIEAKRYMSKLKVVDNAIGALVDGLDSAGKLEDTVIVLFADHYPYGLDDDDYDALTTYDISSNADIDRTPFVIYNPSLTPTKYDDYTSFVNILPTIANLFDLDYDPRLYAGKDVLSETYEGIVVFADGSWRTSVAYYDATKGKVSYIGDETYTDDEIASINTKVKNEIQMDNLAIKNNYFAYLEDILVKKEDTTGEENTTNEDNTEE